MNITLRQLDIFESVATHLNYTKAAKTLHLSQPAVSMQIKQLEDNIGMPLFERVGKKITLTEAGYELSRYCHNISRQLEEAKQVLSEMRGLGRGELRLAVASTANYFLPKLLADFCARHPGIKISLDVTNKEGLLDKLDSNAVDMAIMGQPTAGKELVGVPFLENLLVVIASPHHPLVYRRKIPLAMLQNEVFIVREKGSGTRKAVERFCQSHQFIRPSDMEMSSSEAIKQAVQADLGLGIVSRHTLEMELELKLLCELDVQDFPIVRHWHIVYREGKRFSAVAEAFRLFIQHEAQGLLGEQPDF
ncbi:MAG: LysR family transcriptional regulator [Mariprofundales bacterium]